MHPRSLATSLLNRRQAIVAFVASLGSAFIAPPIFAEDTFIFGTDIDGHDVTSLAGHDAKYIATIFVATDCPISNRYLPEIARLSREFSSRGVNFWLVYPNPGDDLAAVRAHQAQYPVAANLQQLIAPDPRFIHQAHVHVTPEAAVFSSAWPMSTPPLWHGRIDDRYISFGNQRPATTQHDLANAITTALDGQQPTPPAAPPVGCAIISRT